MSNKPVDIHVYTQYYGAQSSAGVLRVNTIIQALKDSYHLEIVSGMGVYPDGIKDEDCRGKRYTKAQDTNGLRVHKVYEFSAPNTGTWKRTLNYVSFMFSCFFFALLGPKPRLIIVSSPPLFVAIGVYMASVMRRIPYVIDIRDLWPESIAALGYLSRRSLVYRLLRWFEGRIYKRALAIVGVTHGIVEGIQALLPESDYNKVHMLYNTSEKVDISFYEDPYLAYQEQMQGRPIVLFAGNMNEAYDFEKVLTYIREHSELFFVFIGDGSQKYVLDQAAQGISHMIVLPRKGFDEIKAYLGYCDKVIVPLQDTDFFKGTFPRKSIDALVNDKEIIYFGPETGEFIDFYRSYDGNPEKFTYPYFAREFTKLIDVKIGVGNT